MIKLRKLIDERLTRSTFPSILYHVTPSINDEGIQSNGLVPKSTSAKKYGRDCAYSSKRIYFVEDKLDVYDIVQILSDFLSPKDYDTSQDNIKDDEWWNFFSVYEVNIKSVLENNKQIRLYADRHYDGGLFTLSPIPPQFIKRIDTIVRGKDF